MQFTTLGEKSLPAVLLIHGMLSSGDDPLIFGKYLADDYYVISPTLTATQMTEVSSKALKRKQKRYAST